MVPLAVAESRQEPSAPALRRSFTIFDGLLYLGKPDLGQRGLVSISGSGDLWRAGVSQDTVDDVRVSSLLQPFHDRNGYFYFDIERWPLRSVPIERRQEILVRLTRLIEVARRTAPHMHLGFYGVLPDITYWPLLRHDREYDDWLNLNRYLGQLGEVVDAIFPSLYTFYGDPAAWTNYARQTLVEARRYQKPVYAFLWPEFHDSNPELRGHNIPAQFWRAELELCATLADGIVLWGGWKQHWDERAPWWQETLLFMHETEPAVVYPSHANVALPRSYSK
jgi:hypothetical protein